jgi:hypothetical protein
MIQTATGDILNRLLAIHRSSFPMYLVDARPWTHSGHHRAVEVLEHVVADQRAMVERIAAMLLQSDIRPGPVRFPMDFTCLNDLSLDFAVREAIRCQLVDIASIARCVDALHDASAASTLAQEALGLAKGHLQALEELVPNHAT